MAEFALGLTKTAVEGTVSRVKSVIEEEEKLKVRVQNDLVFITGEFEMMQSFLHVANKECVKNEVVRTWVRQIRNLAFDVEDCIELVVSVDIKSGWSWLWRMVPSCMAPPRPLDQAIAEIQQLKDRVEDVSHRNTRYNLIGNSGSTSNSSKPAVSSPAQEHMLPATANAGTSSSAFHILCEVWEAAGKMRRDMGDLRKLITDEGSDLEVISLWASPGSAADHGTMSILMKVYNDPEICQGFKSRAWIKLMHPFNLDEFLKSLLTQFYTSSHCQANVVGVDFRKKMKATSVAMEDELMQQVCEQRYLVIVEQLCTVVEWDAIKMYLPNSKNGSRIVLTAQQLGLALSCTGEPYQVSVLRQFSVGQSICAFFNKKKYRDRSRSYPSRMPEARDWTKKFELIGHHSVQHQVSCHLKSGEHRVISVWGIAGVGKSALVKSIYYKNMIDLSSEYYNRLAQVKMYSWVDVHQPFNLKDLSRRLLMDFYSESLEAKETAAVGMMEGQDPIHWCCEFLRQHECFILINGLRSTDDWDMINAAFLSEPTKGYIVVITNEESIAMYCVGKKGKVINIKGLEAEEALYLFTKIAWGSKQLTSDEVELSRLTTTKCGGLPKVIAAIGKYCHASLNKERSLKRINADFMSMLETDPAFHSLRGLFSWMKSYFDDCSDSLKPCIFYLSIFPLAHNFRRRRLLRRWIAEGYSRDTPGSTAEENGEKFFSELVKLSIIQQQQSPSKANLCQINGFFREYIISRSMQDNLVFALEGRCIVNTRRAGQHLTISSNWDRDKIMFESMELSRLRSFTVFGKWKSFFMSADVNMRLLRVLDLEDTLDVTDHDIEHIGELLPRLKFLSLRGCKDITRLPSSLGRMRQLQTLDIKGTTIVTLSPAIMKLEKLQCVRAGATRGIVTSSEGNNGTVVDLAAPPATATAPPPADGNGGSTSQPRVVASASATPPLEDRSISQRPVGADDEEAQVSTPCSSRPRGLVFSWLSKLRRHGLISSAHDGVQFSAAAGGRIGELKALHTLGVVNVGSAGGKTILRELKKLTQLRKLKLSGINQRNWQDFCCTISGHGYLESLAVQLDGDQDLCCLGDISKPPKALKTLKLYGGNVHVSPIWMKQLDGLTKVHFDLELTISTQEDIDSLVELKCKNIYLRICVKPIQDGELRYGRWELVWHGEIFKAATVLKIDCGSYRLAIVFGPFIPDYVEVLVVQCSTTEASLQLFGLENLKELKEIWLKGCYSDAVKQHLQEKMAEHWRKPVLKLEDQQSVLTLPSAC